jgi:hypothetical protein
LFHCFINTYFQQRGFKKSRHYYYEAPGL